MKAKKKGWTESCATSPLYRLYPIRPFIQSWDASEEVVQDFGRSTCFLVFSLCWPQTEQGRQQDAGFGPSTVCRRTTSLVFVTSFGHVRYVPPGWPPKHVFPPRYLSFHTSVVLLRSGRTEVARFWTVTLVRGHS